MNELEEQYHKGYNTAKNTYSKRITQLKQEYRDELAHIDICKTYPYNVLMEVIEESETTQVRYYSPKLVEKVISESLTERQAKILYMIYGLGYTLEECAKEFNVTRERVRQIQAKTIRMLKHPSRLQAMRVIPLDEHLKTLRERDELEQQIAVLTDELNKKNSTNLKAEEIISKTNMYSYSLEDMDLSVRSYNCLKRAGCNTLGDVKKLIDSDQLWRVRNLGRRSHDEVCAKVTEITNKYHV